MIPFQNFRFRLNATSIYLHPFVPMSHMDYNFLSTFPSSLGLASISKILDFIVTTCT